MNEQRNLSDRLENRVLPTDELRRQKPSRTQFLTQPRNPIVVVLDGVRQNYNLGAMFRLCDAFMAERLVVCSAAVLLNKRKLVQAAAGTQRWVPWQVAEDVMLVIRSSKADDRWIIVTELAAQSISPEEMRPRFPATLVLGGESTGISPSALAYADEVVAIPMLGMANSLNVATAAAIMLYELARRCPPFLRKGSRNPPG